MNQFYTAESVTEGHPDKLCDLIADSVLDECLSHDALSRVACEVMATRGQIIVAGEITSLYEPSIPSIVRSVLRKVGYSPLTGDFHENEIDEYGWNNGISDYPTLFDGTDMVCYEESIRPVVEQYTGNLMSYFYKQRNPGIKEKVISAIPSIEIRNGELMGCTTVVLKEPLADEEMEDLQDYLHGQFSDGWGEGFEQQEIQTDDGVLYVHFGEAEPFYFEVKQMQLAEAMKEQLPPHRPKMKLVGQDGNIFSILGRASRLLKENGQPDQAKEMCDRVYQSGDYYKALNIISEYVETELSEKTLSKQKKRSDPER